MFNNRYNYDGRAEDGSEWYFISNEMGGEKEHVFTRAQLDKLCPHLYDYLEYFEGMKKNEKNELKSDMKRTKRMIRMRRMNERINERMKDEKNDDKNERMKRKDDFINTAI